MGLPGAVGDDLAPDFGGFFGLLEAVIRDGEAKVCVFPVVATIVADFFASIEVCRQRGGRAYVDVFGVADEEELFGIDLGTVALLASALGEARAVLRAGGIGVPKGKLEMRDGGESAVDGGGVAERAGKSLVKPFGVSAEVGGENSRSGSEDRREVAVVIGLDEEECVVTDVLGKADSVTEIRSLLFASSDGVSSGAPIPEETDRDGGDDDKYDLVCPAITLEKADGLLPGVRGVLR